MSEGNANLKLMAAAPELLGALEEMKRWAEGGLHDGSGKGDAPIEIAEAAIKKAI